MSTIVCFQYTTYSCDADSKFCVHFHYSLGVVVSAVFFHVKLYICTPETCIICTCMFFFWLATFNVMQVQPLNWPFSIHWKKGKMGINTHCGGFEHATTVVIDDMVYCSSKNEPAVVAGYSIATGIWSNLPPPPIVNFGMTSFNGQLVLAGGKSGRKYKDFVGYVYSIVESRITV